MELNWGGVSTPESRRYSNSVRTVLRERFMAALSAIAEREGMNESMDWLKVIYATRYVIKVFCVCGWDVGVVDLEQ